jgi:hypothetical protein
MIHVNVRTNPNSFGFRFQIQASTDGAGFDTKWECNERTHAETIGRAYASGCAYAGAETRLTMFGSSCPVPQP